MKQKIQAGEVFDFVTPGEMKEHLNLITLQSAQERARGVTIWRDTAEAAVTAGVVTVPAVGTDNFIVNPGYAVIVQSARAAGLLAGDSIGIYRGVVTDKTFVGQLTSSAPAIGFGSKGLILKGGEKLVFRGSALMATAVTVNAEGIEVPETDLYKLVAP